MIDDDVQFVICTTLEESFQCILQLDPKNHDSSQFHLLLNTHHLLPTLYSFQWKAVREETEHVGCNVYGNEIDEP